MSMNIKINAEREVYSKEGKPYGKQEIHFNVWQTPTKISYELLKADNPAEEYKKWALSITEEELMEVYAEDDPFGERGVIRKERYHRGEEHCVELDNFIKYATENDYKMVYEVW